jgi:transposase
MSWTVAIGIDTHKDEHVAVAFDRLGRQLDARSEAAGAAGYLALWRWATALGEPAFAIEGAGSYGAGLTRFLLASGAEVYECERPRRRERRQGKSDLLDAARAGRCLLSGEGLSRPRGGGPREDLRLLLGERRGAVRAQTATLNQLQAVLVAAPERLRTRLAALRGQQLVAACVRLRPGAAAEHVPSGVLRRLGRRAQALAEERSTSSSSNWSPSWCRSCSSSAASERSVPLSSSSRAAIRGGCARRPPSPRWPARARSTPRAGSSKGTVSTAAATAS